jgi:hypothetical protein
MNKNTRKSTALVSLVLVPLNLLGLGFTGCDTQDDNTPSYSATDADGNSDGTGDFEEVDDGFNLDPVPSADVTAAAPTVPTTQPLARSSFATQPGYPTHHYHSGGGIVFLPIPYRTGYSPPYRPTYRSSPTFSRSSGGSGVSRSSSSSVSRGGFGSTGHSASSSS